LKFQQLKYFVAVYEEGSFSAGAARMNATQSGLSMHVRELEKRYDVVLFERSSAGVEPTETGRLFYQEAISVLNASEVARDKLKELSGVLSDHINIGLMPAFARAVLSPTLLRFAQEQKHVRVSVSEAYSGQLSLDVAEGKLDFAVVPSYNSELDLSAKSMGHDQECLACSAHTRLSIGSEATLSELPPLRMILPSKANARRPLIEHYLSVNGIDWVSILPAVLSPPDKDGRKRLFTPLANPPLAVEYMRITHKARPLSKASQAFADVLQEELNNVLEADPLSKR